MVFQITKLDISSFMIVLMEQTADRTMAKMLITASAGNQPPKQQQKCPGKNKIH